MGALRKPRERWVSWAIEIWKDLWGFTRRRKGIAGGRSSAVGSDGGEGTWRAWNMAGASEPWRTRRESQGVWSCFLKSHWSCLELLFAHLPMSRGFGEIVYKITSKEMLGLAFICWLIMSTWINALKTGLGDDMWRSLGCILWTTEWVEWENPGF